MTRDIKFRKLTAEELESRCSTVYEKGGSVLI